MEKKYFSIITFLFGMLACGILSVCLGKELQWDLAAYHFYNPYAFLYHRYQQDYWPPSALQMFLSPTLDFLNYFLIRSFRPITTEFLLGALHGINVGILFCIAQLMLKNEIKNPISLLGTALLLAFLGMYSPTVFSGIGGFFNDNVVAIFVLSFVLLMIKCLQNEVNKWQLIWNFFILGCAIGMKLTAASYGIGALASLLINHPVIASEAGQSRSRMTMLSHSIKLAAYTVLSLLIGLLVTNGYWMWHLWQQYQNPFFPFYNQIFHSSYFPAINWQDKRFMPESWQQWLFFPFYFSTWRKAITELYSTDYRFIFIYILLIAVGIRWFITKSLPKLTLNQTWFYGFFIFSYVAWEMNFSVLRYLGVLQMLAPLFIVLLVFDLVSSAALRICTLAAIFVCLFLTMHPMGVERTYAYGNSYFNVAIPFELKRIPKATVLMPYAEYTVRDRPNPNQYLIPFFPTSWRFGGVGFNKKGYVITPAVRDFVRENPGRIFLLAASHDMPLMYRMAKELHLNSAEHCYRISSDRQVLSKEQILLCEVR